MTLFNDEALVLRAENRNESDKFITCYTRNHGRVRFTVYGARHQKSVAGKILQPFRHVYLELETGRFVDRLRSSELASLPVNYDFGRLAYAGVLAELTEIFTVDHEADEALFFLLKNALLLLIKRQPRLVVLSYAVKLLWIAGFNPRTGECLKCHAPAEGKMFFSPSHGGVLCSKCCQDGLAFDEGARELFHCLQNLDLENPQDFTVLGFDLMQVERVLEQFIVFQTDKSLNSLAYLRQIGI